MVNIGERDHSMRKIIHFSIKFALRLNLLKNFIESNFWVIAIIIKIIVPILSCIICNQATGMTKISRGGVFSKFFRPGGVFYRKFRILTGSRVF